MASKALKGLTIEIGADTSDLNKALDKVDKQSRSLSSELGQINKLLKMDPQNTELLAQKQKVLADAIKNTESRLDTLKEAEKQVQAQFERGEVSEAQYRALQREIIETEAKLGKYKNAAKETADAVEALGKESGKAAGKIDEQAEKTEKAEKASDDLNDSADDLAAGGLAAVAAAAAAAAAAVVALAEESREYRTEMAKLDTAFQDAKFSTEAATKTYEALQGVLGETDQAVEAANHLAKLCSTEEELAAWTEIATGVYASFGASLPIEGLTEAANETMRAGQVTGPFADALNWAAKEGETFGVKLKKATKQNAEWNKKVEEAATAEDYFNLALEECSTQQERQQLITQTLTKLYGSAAKQYKATNAEVIRANEATEKWNKATAKIGKAVEPVVTDIKELGTTLLQDAEEPLKDTAKYIQKEVIPAIKNISKWVKQNGPLIKATLVGITTALIAYKAATVATTVAHKGLKGAIKATMVAEKALQLVQASSPWGLVAVAIATVTTALIAYAVAAKDSQQPVDVLTKEERELMAAANEAAEAFRDQKKATKEALGNIASEMQHTQDLADELRDLADASGKVKEKDQARADFILGRLNEALGTEYTMVDGVIQQYKDLVTSIDEAIRKELAFALTAEMKDDWITAQKEKAAAMDNVNLSYKDYQAQLQKVAEAEETYEYWDKLYMEAVVTRGALYAQEYAKHRAAAKGNLEAQQDALAKAKTAHDTAVQDYNNYTNTIISYEEAQQAAMEGNYEKAIGILSAKGESHSEYADTVDEETARTLDALKMEAIDAGLYAEWVRENFQNGVEGFTQPMVDEAETNYQKAMDEFANAYADAESVGEDLSEGMTAGAENKRASLLEKARSLVAGFLAAAREAADSHSPSRKAIAIFEDIGEGAEIGVENKTKDVARAGKDQAGAVLDAYRAQEINAQKALRNVAETQSARQTAGQMTAATANNGALEAILAAIKEGQVLLLDGDTVVGGTANKMDSRLGQLRVLAARGAR